MSKLVSVVIPTYGRQETLIKSVNSVLAQTYHNVEVIVIDDNGLGSEQQRDNEKLLSSLDCEIKYYANRNNIGGAESRNIGVKYANGEYISFLDDDDLYHKEKIKFQIDIIERTNNTSEFCLCDMNILDVSTNNFIENDLSCTSNFDDIFSFMTTGKFLTPMIMLHKDLFMAVGGFDNIKKFQDHVLMLKLLRKGAKPKIIKSKLFTHCHHNNERISSNPKVLSAYHHRFSLENEILKESDFKANEYRQIKYRQCYEYCKIFSINGNFKCFFKYFLSGLIYVTSFKSSLSLCKTAQNFLKR